MYVCTGLIFATSGYLIPQLKDSYTGFGISDEDGSWVGNVSYVYFDLHNNFSSQ